jgi:hypothetical protein
MNTGTPGAPPADGIPGLCRHLRTKRYYYGTSDEVLEVADLSTTAQFWCLRTMRVVGPDQGSVSAAACRPGRSCCEPDQGPARAGS